MQNSNSISKYKKAVTFKKIKLSIILSGIFITTLVLTLYILDIEILRLIDHRLYDMSLKAAVKEFNKKTFSDNSNNKSSFKNDQVIKDSYTSVIVDIDEYSLSHFGQWPWPRYRVAKLINKIHDAGAVSIGIDILFSEPDRTSIIQIQKALKDEFNVDVTFSNLPDLKSNLYSDSKTSDSNSNNFNNSNTNIDLLIDNDIFLSKAISQTSATLGYYFNFQSKFSDTQYTHQSSSVHNKSYLAPLSSNIVFQLGSDPSEIFNKYLFKAINTISPLPVLTNEDTNSGFMNTLADKDGVLRRTPLFILWDNKIYPQLALSTLLNSNLLNHDSLDSKNSRSLNSKSESEKGNFINSVIKISSNGVESIKLNNKLIYLDQNGSMLLNYRGPAYTFPYISAAKILQNDFKKEQLKGRIVFLGSSAAGLKDIRMTPFDHNFPGVEVHATIIDNIIKGDFLLRPDWSSSFEVILTILCGIITTILIGYTGAFLTLILTIALIIIIYISTFWEIYVHHIWISPLYPFITLFLNFAILNFIKYGSAEKEKKFYRSAFSHYVSQSVVNQIIESPEKFNLDGEEKEITILFSDIRGFSSISEKLSPSQVSRLLHSYFTPITKVIIDYQGTLDKFIGDAIMCFWNTPAAVENHKALALSAAIQIIKTLEKLSVSFEKDYGVKIKTGIGIHSGICRVGNMGSADLFDYTAIGDNVNIASRFEGLTKFYGVDIIFSEIIVPATTGNDLLIQYIDKVRVKGKTEPIDIYTAYIISDVNSYASMQFDIDQYNIAINKYKNREFKTAFDIFSELDENKQGRIKLYSIYKKRAWTFMNDPPDSDWDCVYNHTSK